MNIINHSYTSRLTKLKTMQLSCYKAKSDQARPTVTTGCLMLSIHVTCQAHLLRCKQQIESEWSEYATRQQSVTERETGTFQLFSYICDTTWMLASAISSQILPLMASACVRIWLGIVSGICVSPPSALAAQQLALQALC